MNSLFTTIKQRYSAVLIGFTLLVSVLTWLGIQRWIAPSLRHVGEQNLVLAVGEISTDIRHALSAVQAQQRATTQLVPKLSSDNIDRLLPSLVDQYGNELVFGGGIWPLPNQRIPGQERASTFYHRDTGGRLIENTFWNSAEAPDYFTQPWHVAGQNAPRGACVWAAAYKDGASTQPRTNCAMGIYKNGQLYGVSTVDVTLGFFNTLVADKEQELNAEILIVERDGKILSKNRELTGDNVILTNLADHRYPLASAMQSALRQSQSRLEFTQNNEDYTLLLKDVEGTPWLVGVAQPTRLLTAQSQQMLGTLAKIQLPMVALLLIILLLALSQLTRRLDNLKQNVDSLSAGDADLRMRLPVKGSDEVDAISESMNHFIIYLQNLVNNVMQANQACSQQITAMTEVTEKTLNVLEQHVNETDMVATAVNQLSASAQDVAGHTAQSTQITNAAQKQSDITGQSAAQATGSVKNLVSNVELTSEKVTQMQENAASIESVLQVIGGIAEQTNLLALNAAIEAARAGELGRGFAVVADEVRNLAARTQESTTEVEEMLHLLKVGVDETVAAMSETKQQCLSTAEMTENVNQGITTMTASVLKVDDISLQIATAANEQSKVAENINERMDSIRTMLQQLHMHGRSSGEHATALEAANAQLQQLVGQFKV
ncbi:methyl-accepting chemotaxis protein [Photobacterium atrarenae]|uniref:Methyl-accepting chemotaxis protein n=1 Tax=Photobacterium atrarenae TaxID=865757 RepID=A0ABY5GCZ0_9GAMM|nr:methyl-accepting chemotaxis protein [Photobacterium atrarenae]UTV26726.1 methyl-accepting chemotaxis protein [Photobacterium atrarenae]